MTRKEREAKQLAELQKEVDDFNSKYNVGNKVNLELDSGEIIPVTVKHEATILSGHTAVGWFKEQPSCYLLSRVK